jgi:hypothetical protein
LQNCTNVLLSLLSGELGSCEAAAADYKLRCHQRFPCALIFGSRVPETTTAALVSSENNFDMANNHDDNCIN